MRSSTRITCVAVHSPSPRAVGMPCALSPSAMARRLVFPAACSSFTMGAGSATLSSAAPAGWQLVIAGPGAGKSAVACQCAAYLVDEAIPPSRILLVSFTRTAVAELRDRIVSYAVAGAVARTVRISTIDSHAWSIDGGRLNRQQRVDTPAASLGRLAGEKPSLRLQSCARSRLRRRVCRIS
jgi:hypothetical protein